MPKQKRFRFVKSGKPEIIEQGIDTTGVQG